MLYNIGVLCIDSSRGPPIDSRVCVKISSASTHLSSQTPIFVVFFWPKGFFLMLFQAKIRVVETVVLENGVFVKYRKQVVLTKIRILRSIHKNKGVCSRPRTSTKMTNMADVTQTKWHFAKSTVLTTPRRALFLELTSPFSEEVLQLFVPSCYFEKWVLKTSNKHPRRNQKDWTSKVHPSNMNPPQNPTQTERHRDCDATHKQQEAKSKQPQ